MKKKTVIETHELTQNKMSVYIWKERIGSQELVIPEKDVVALNLARVGVTGTGPERLL